MGIVTRSRGYSDLVCMMVLLLVSLFGLKAGAADKTEIKGFYGIPWGANLAERNELRLVEETEHVESYELKDGSPLLGEAKLSMLRFVATDGQFARVAIRYSGEKNHAEILRYLQSIFGPIDERSPGSMMRGLNQQFTWRSMYRTSAGAFIPASFRSLPRSGCSFLLR